MSKLNFILLLPIWLGYALSGYGQNNKTNDEFLFAVIELHKVENGAEYDVEFKMTKVVSEKLRIPTKSEFILPESENTLNIQILDNSDNILDEITFNDPFIVTREYVNEDGNFAQARVVERDRSILIRRPISDKATQLNVLSKSNKRSSKTFKQKFR